MATNDRLVPGDDGRHVQSRGVATDARNQGTRNRQICNGTNWKGDFHEKLAAWLMAAGADMIAESCAVDSGQSARLNARTTLSLAPDFEPLIYALSWGDVQ